MADYPINKGIGHSVEFKGLKAQYLFIFAGGLLVVFFLVVVLYMAGADQLVCIGLGLTLGSLLVWGNIPPEQQVRRAWTDETPCLQEPSTLYPQPKENKPNVQT